MKQRMRAAKEAPAWRVGATTVRFRLRNRQDVSWRDSSILHFSASANRGRVPDLDEPSPPNGVAQTQTRRFRYFVRNRADPRSGSRLLREVRGTVNRPESGLRPMRAAGAFPERSSL